MYFKVLPLIMALFSSFDRLHPLSFRGISRRLEGGWSVAAGSWFSFLFLFGYPSPVKGKEVVGVSLVSPILGQSNSLDVLCLLSIKD